MKEKMFFIIAIIIFEISMLNYLNIYEKNLKNSISKDAVTKEISNIIDRKGTYINDKREESNIRNVYLEKEEEVMRDEYDKNTKLKRVRNNKEEIFKMDTEIIVKSLTSKEIREILKLSKSLNVREFMQMKDYLFESNREKALLEAINLLQDAFTDEEYEEAKKIADRFIYVDVAEKLAKDVSNLN